MKKRLIMLLALVMLFAAFSCPALASEPWDILNSDLSEDYTSAWKVSGGSFGGAVTQEDGYVSIVKGDDKTVSSPTGGAYTWLVPQSLTLPESGKLTAEVTLRAGAEVDADKYGEISVRFGKNANDTNGKLYPVFIKYGAADGWIAPYSDGTGAYALDTTLWHNYGLVIDLESQTYNIYIDGALVLKSIPATTYKGGNLFRIGADNNARCDLDVRSARMGSGDRSESLSGAVLFEDDFSNDNGAWTPNLENAWSVQNGVYTQNQTSGTLSYAGSEAWTNYSVEADVRTPSDAKGTVMLVGRATDVGRYYGAWANGKLSIQRRFNSSDSAKLLTSMSLSMDYSFVHRWRLDFAGQTISLYIDGELKLEYTDTDNAFPNGKIGFGTNKTKGFFDNVIVRSLATPRAALSLTTPADYQVIQRNTETQRADVALSGELNMTEPASIQARVIAFDAQDDAEPIVDWTTVAENVSGEWTGTLKDVPQGGWYRIDLRASSAEGNIVAEAAGETRWGVGINILCIGQSNMVGQGAAPYTEANDLAANCRWGQWKHLKDPYDGAGASIVPAMVNALIDELQLPVGVVPAAYSGSGLHTPNTNHGKTQYWMFLDENNHFNTGTLYGRAITRARDAGGVELVVWNQGETDGALSVSKEDYKQDMQVLLSRLREDLGVSDLPLFLCQIGTHAENISNNEAYTGIRSAQLELDDGENIFLAATEMEFERKDTAHYKTPGLNEIGRRVANAMLYHYGKSTYYRGPSIVSVAYADASRKIIDVTITHRGGTDIGASEQDYTGFLALDNADTAEIVSAVRLNETTIRLTLAQSIAGSGSLRYLYGLNPDVSNIVKDNTAMQLPLEGTTDALPIGNDAPFVNTWDIVDHDMAQWDSENWRSSTKTGTITQKDGYVNIKKDNSCALASASKYHWVVSPAGLALPRSGFTFQTEARVTGAVDAAANEIAVRMGLHSEDLNGKIGSIFLGYGEEGFVSTSASGTGRYVMQLDTTVWHTYTMVVRPDGDGFVFDLYVDNTLAFDSAPLTTYKGGDLLRFGADNSGRCDLDVRHVRAGSGEILPEGVSPARLRSVTLSESTQKESEKKKVTVTVTGEQFTDGDEVVLTLLDSKNNALNVTAVGSFHENVAQVEMTFPARLPVNDCYVRAEANGRTAYSAAYIITADREAPHFPTFEAKAYTIELEDYLYNPTQEFNFPCVVDTKDHPVSNAMGDYRYYLFYAPHDAPAGNCVAASNSLDGPWTEYSANPVVSKVWQKEDGSGNYYSVSHVSSPHVMWNDGIGKYVMYFHGENPTTRYATSDDLINWTYGGVCVNANDFSPTGSGLNEASYARVFEHKIPGLGNKYIMLLMVTGSATGGHRNIYWAYSTDGFDWTPVQTPLLNPDMDAQYMNNFSGPYFMEWDVNGETRYFVICHASSGEIYAFEVGAALDEVIPWGIVYESKGQRYDSDRDDDAEWPDYGRAGAPCFMQDDDGVWHMFYEGGKRLHANIVHAVQTFSDSELAARVDAAIEALPKLEDLTLDDSAKVEAARALYVALSEAQKELVEKLDVLEAAEKRLEELKGGDKPTPPASDRPNTPAPGQSKPSSAWKNPFADVQPGSWYFDAVRYVEQNGLMSGVCADAFAPDATTTRGMIVTILYRLEQKPDVNGKNVFTDVRSGSYCEDAVIWATETKIVSGYGNGLFGPNDAITREQLAVFLYRYAAYKGYDVSARASLDGFADRTQISGYAYDAMSWAYAEGLITGKSASTLAPKGEATRAEVATILMRYCGKYEN